MNDRQKAFTEAMVAAVFSGGFRGTVKAPLPKCEGRYGGRQQGKSPEPPKKRAKPVDFFPSKIDRIAKMPRYPGVWG